MLLSVTQRFIFVHVNKVAGSSIQRALAPFGHKPPGDSMSKLKSKLHLMRDYRQRYYAEHTFAAQLQKELPGKVFDQFFKFAFVRNPWDWLAATYHYICHTPTHRHHRRVAAMASFSEYADFEIGRGKRSQAEFVCDGDDIIVDFVGRFETLQQDFTSVCRQIGIEASLPHVNKTNHRDYRQFYDDAMIEKVAGHWRRDIDLFGYEFEGLKDGATRIFKQSR